jgi:hypothetical protein
MALLDSLVEKRIRLIDYETITEDGSRGGSRLVAFGRFALQCVVRHAKYLFGVTTWRGSFFNFEKPLRTSHGQHIGVAYVALRSSAHGTKC